MKYGAASKVIGDHIKVPLWLTFDVRGNVRLTRGEPDLRRNERAMQMTVTVPLALFKTPTISANLVIDAPEMAVPQIDVSAAAEALKNIIGCDVDVRVNDASVDRSPKGEDRNELHRNDESAVPKGQTPNHTQSEGTGLAQAPVDK